MNQRKLQSVKSRIKRLARDSCANFNGQNGCFIAPGGCCLLTYDSEGTGNVCPYFLRSVLPVDPKLEMEYRELFGVVVKQQEAPGHLCEECGKPYKRTSNRQKFCGAC
ncbi:cysteine-rich VLP protein [Fictibacillus sp. Mic-4]|uniref:cysteine-rich VLP protein n=1 Tax=Fictibacillus sp. Mic-4 TaxID=3132826 RepID=UPI003CEA3487